ncbi:penicillin-binding protein [Paenibacillus harenae]|uniref:Penicillin-binding protein 2B n=1 Tax=Paenibacillus harenae TaxID=306543 RepID=A0ABT9TZW9_PAEHA|nr:PASTA domain-containing penicillin-binding protein [Paenibacillus harenae]MDQ0112863.1 penicillin-binding protein 2B [Paenibacillus harenae]
MKKRIKLRTLVFGGIMTLLFFFLISRIYWVQVVDGAEWYERAVKRWSAQETIVAKRGTITDRNGNVIAMDSHAYTVAVNPQAINDAGITEEVVAGLHKILNKPESELRKIVTAKDEKGAFYKQREVRQEGFKIDKALADQVKALRDEIKEQLTKDKKKVSDVGIYLMDELKRYYPSQLLASQLVGFVDKEGKAKSGVEAYFNDQLEGVNGEIKFLKDGKRVQLSDGEVEYQAPEEGQDIALTIDSIIQSYVEEALREIVAKYNPKSITAIAADPNTMEILAMANMPEFNPNSYWDSNYANYNNHGVVSLYEPGSTFKIMTLAAAVEEGVFNPNETYKSGSVTIYGDTIRDIQRGGWGTISYLDGLKHSSNVAFVNLGYEKLGAEKLRDYLTKFGFAQKTGIQLSGERTGVLQMQYPIEVATAAIGQGVAVTPIQQVAAVAAVANGGKLMQPQIIKSITDPTTKKTTVFEPKVVRQVISKETSRKVGEYLEQVVSDQEIGTGRRAFIEGYRIAGKTGTAEKSIDGKYSEDKFVVSFVGYAPVENPKIVLYIVVDEPDDSTVGGGLVAAPAFREIMLKSLRHMGIMPDTSLIKEEAKKEAPVVVPAVTDLLVAQAKATLTPKNIQYELIGNGKTVLQQIPAAGSIVNPSQRVYLLTEQRDKLKVPNMTGLSLRDALEITTLLGIQLMPEGQGYVVSQKEETKNGKRTLKIVLAPQTGAGAVEGDDGSADSSDEQNNGTGDTGEADNGDSNATGDQDGESGGEQQNSITSE